MQNAAQHNEYSVTTRLVRGGGLIVLLFAASLSWAQTPPPSGLSDKSDQELTELTARWSDLSPSERRVLLAEVRRRMQFRRASQIAQGAAPRARITLPPNARVRVQRRYGRIVRQPDGSVIVQQRVVGKIEPGVPQTTDPTDPNQAPSTDPNLDPNARVVADGVTSERPPQRGVRGRITFGFGFERRARDDRALPNEESGTQVQYDTPPIEP